MNIEKLKKILSIPSCSQKEERVREYITNFAIDNNIPYVIDEYGNIFLKKGIINENEAYPCVVAHMDTVHKDQIDMVHNNDTLIINENVNNLGEHILYAQRTLSSGVQVNTGCGGDDKAGLFISLTLIENFDCIMGAFFIEEEIGCNGSRLAKKGLGHEWLSQAGYFIQFDAPTDSWISRVCSGVELFNDNFENKLLPVWNKYELSKPNLFDPFTDVKELRLKYPVCCINYFAGYMDMHRSIEYVVIPYVEKAISVGASTIIELGKNEYLF